MSNRPVDTRELELPETHFIRDIDDHVFQTIVAESLMKVEGVGLVTNQFFDHLLGRDRERYRGIVVEQDNKNHSVSIRVEVNISYGVPIPKKAEEIQTLLTEQITALTGLHVSGIHVVFKNILPQNELVLFSDAGKSPYSTKGDGLYQKHYNDEFLG